jgi:DNA polymerase V
MSASLAGAPVFALQDGNNFYVSCERVFNPRLENKPVCVLSSNDGCAIARSSECKALGVKMGDPLFQLQDLVRRHGLICLSSNFALYGDLSARVLEVLSQFSPDIEPYSIDENFVRVERMRLLWPDLTQMGQAMVARVKQWVNIPTCVGFGTSKTMAKLSNHVAKKNPQFGGVFDSTSYPAKELDALLATISVGEVWGVGRRIAEKLNAMGIHTVQDLRQSSPKFIRSHFSVVMERTVAELQGISCLDLEDVAPPKQQIISSKSFGTMVSTQEELGEALTSYVTRAAEKLRAQRSVCGAVHVFVMTNRFRERDPQYCNGITIPLPNPSADTMALAGAALAGLKAIYRKGYAFKKTGVMLLDLSPAGIVQGSLFDQVEVQSRQSDVVMAALDSLNARFGRDTVTVAAAGTQKRWVARAENRTQRFTTRWTELPKAYAK